MQGYKVVGVRERVCLANGEWSEEEPTCQLIYCPRLPEQMPHGSVTGAEETPLYAAVVQFSCDPGYELQGAQQVTCEDDEQWSAPFPVCRPINCPFPGLVPHAKASLNRSTTSASSPPVPIPFNEQAVEYEYGDLLNYTCRKRYAAQGGASVVERRCLADGTWSGKAPSCSRIHCPPISIPQNGFTSLPAERGSNSTTSGTDVIAADDQLSSSAISGQVVKFGCSIGYQLATGSASSAECLENGQWSVAQPVVCVKIQCPQPTAIKNGKIVNVQADKTSKEYFYKDQVEYTCDFGFRLDQKRSGGQQQLTCTASGTWSSSPPICTRAVCPFKDSVDQLENGQITVVFPPDALKTSQQHPSALKFSCRAGYELIGSGVTQCQGNGEWSHPWPTCKNWPCDSAPLPPHGRIISTEIHPSGEFIVALPGCEPGYSLSTPINGGGGLNLTCGPSGTWKGRFECHESVCRPPDGLTHQEAMRKKKVQHAIGAQLLNRSSDYRYGERIHFECLKGHRLASSTLNTSLICADEGLWQGQMPSCLPVPCPPLQAPSFGSIAITNNNNSSSSNQTAVYGAIATFSCNEGFRLEGTQQQMTCQFDGTWTDWRLNTSSDNQRHPLCIAVTCSSESAPLVAPENGWMVIRGDKVGDTGRPPFQSIVILK